MLTRKCMNKLTEILDTPSGVFKNISYDRKSDILRLDFRKKRIPILEESFHLFIDQGYARCTVVSNNGSAQFAYAFNPDAIHKDIKRVIQKSPFPSLDRVMNACEQAGGYPTFIRIIYPLF